MLRYVSGETDRQTRSTQYFAPLLGGGDVHTGISVTLDDPY